MRSNKKRSRAALSKSTVSILSTEDEAIARSSTTIMAFQFRTTTVAPTAAGATGAVPAALFSFGGNMTTPPVVNTTTTPNAIATATPPPPPPLTTTMTRGNSLPSTSKKNIKVGGKADEK